MKSESEKKSIVKSIKLSPSQVQQIEEKANEKNMTFSSYMVDCALHNNQGITPQIAVKYQELINMVQEIAHNINCKDNGDIYNAYEQFLFVKKYFGKTSGNPVFHFIVVYNAKSTWGNNDEHTAEMSHRIASYFSDRYQIVYGIHHKPCYNKCGKCTSLYHVHFIMNSVSYIDGKMFSGNCTEIYAFLEHIKRVTGDKSWTMEYDSDKENGNNGVFPVI